MQTETAISIPNLNEFSSDGWRRQQLAICTNDLGDCQCGSGQHWSLIKKASPECGSRDWSSDSTCRTCAQDASCGTRETPDWNKEQMAMAAGISGDGKQMARSTMVLTDRKRLMTWTTDACYGGVTLHCCVTQLSLIGEVSRAMSKENCRGTTRTLLKNQLSLDRDPGET